MNPLKSALCAAVLVVALGSIAWFDDGAFGGEGPPATARAVFQPPFGPYERIRKWIGDNPGGGITAWGMSYDHLFLNYRYGDPEKDDCLRELCRRFVRTPGGIDLLFTKIVNRTTSDEDLVAITQILMFWGWDDEPGDDRINSTQADAVVEALRDGRVKRAETKYPELSLSYHIRISALKARPHRPKAGQD